jgi:hypothetical protein
MLFISYSKKDLDFVRYLRALLAAEGFEVWFDQELHPGEDWWDELEGKIRGCAAFVVVMSPDAKNSRYVRRELLLAESLNLPIFPVLLSGEVWSNLADLQYADMRQGLHAKLPSKLLSSLKAVLSPHAKSIRFSIEYGDILTYEADVAAFKYAQSFLGAEQIAANALSTVGISEDMISPAGGSYTLVDTSGALAAKQALFVGTARLRHLGYDGVRKLAAESLFFLRKAAPETRHLVMTIHGPGFGLDESEAFRSQFNGYLEALSAGTYPPLLERISIVEFNEARVERLQQTLERFLDGEAYAKVDENGGYRLTIPEVVKPAKKKAAAKTHAYVITPSGEDDVFYYGIQSPVHALGLLCERVDYQEITEDWMEQVKTRIDNAAVVIADLSARDPKLYWQVGYAWGKERPVIVLANKADAVLFPNLPLVTYSKIRDVETALAEQLARLKQTGQL